MTVSRRWFLIGSATAVGAAAVGLPALEAPAFVAPLRRAVGFIKVHNIVIAPNGVAVDAAALTFDVKRLASEYSLLHLSIHQSGIFRWRALLGGEIIVPPKDALRISCTPDPGRSATAIIGYADAEHEHFIDRFEWHNGVATVVDSQPLSALPLDDEDDL